MANWLERIGSDIIADFKKILPVAEEVQEAAAPFENLALPGLSTIINIGLQQIGTAEALGVAAAAGQDSSSAKLASVTASLATSIGPILQNYGVVAPTTAQYQKFIDALVEAAQVFEFPAPAATPAPAPAPQLGAAVKN